MVYLGWHVALALGTLCLVLYALAQVPLRRARDEWANAFFYSPSQKGRLRQLRKRWQDRCSALLACAVVSFVAAAALYLTGPT